MDEIDRAVAALRRHIEAAINDPEIAALPPLVERIKRFMPLLLPEPTIRDCGRLTEAVQSADVVQRYLAAAIDDSRILEADRQKLHDAALLVFGIDIDDDGIRELADAEWSKQGQARKAANSRWRGKQTKDAIAWAKAALERREYPSKNAAALAAAAQFGVSADTVRRALKDRKPR